MIGAVVLVVVELLVVVVELVVVVVATVVLVVELVVVVGVHAGSAGSVQEQSVVLQLSINRLLARAERRAHKARASGGDLFRADIRVAWSHRCYFGDKAAHPERNRQQRDNCFPSHRRAPLWPFPGYDRCRRSTTACHLFDTLVKGGKSRRDAGDAAVKLPLCR